MAGCLDIGHIFTLRCRMVPFYSTLQTTFCDRHSRNRLVPEKRIRLILFTFLWVDKINVYQVRERGEAVQAVWFGKGARRCKRFGSGKGRGGASGLVWAEWFVRGERERLS